ncbi:thioredoxin-like fold domain-containing protein MRL7L, chloroplastic isoform X2 [Jatropha curcas]|uniref:thioredoxin-like fold domain-containing protein MRL7L, chloroplastic isoform X2 n=1 Tax=Jatropha curcas TaxID=180498 RepID=UPI0005FADB90|nr:thioredoxin-like fold domain-containing protein MRL7L, chloroplastic isoform X2 [Jatropha curcas]XP_037495331.1 thioredoxin-like fold domain-containing protein MRL7L, chloroplastic isoform X2 [Jatropha curcas]
MALQHTLRFQKLFSPIHEYKFKDFPSAAGINSHSEAKRRNNGVSSCSSSRSSKFLKVPLQGGGFRTVGVRASRSVKTLSSNDGKKKRWEESSDTDDDDYEDSDDDNSTGKKSEVNDPYLMDAEERREWRRKIREVIDKHQDVEEELDLEEKKIKMQKLLADYPLVVAEDDPDWPEDADGWGFNLGQFFNKITIKNKKKDDDDENYDSENEIVWQDDNYIRPIKDITTAEWEETVFKDISPLIILVHNRYKRPKENEKIRVELDMAVNIIWNCRLPSPRCVAIDAVIETDLVSALKVSVFPEIIFTKAGKILYREKAIRTADEFSKIMAYFYYGAGKPPCLNDTGDSQELIPSVPISS